MKKNSALQRKRNKSKEMRKVNEQGNPYEKKKKYSPEERFITFVDNDIENKLEIKSSYDFCRILELYKFNMPYYIENGTEVILTNLDNKKRYFHFGNNSKIYNYKYKTYFSEKEFNDQINSYKDRFSNNLKELFYNKDYFLQYHLESYTTIHFKNVLFNFNSFRDLWYEDKAINVIELFAKSGIGITTHLFLYFLKYRENNRPKERFIPFLILDYRKLKIIKTIEECYFLLNFAIVNCFLDFEEYKTYSTKLYELISKNGLNNIENIIYTIINDITNIFKEKEYFYNPTVIIDRYSFAFDKKDVFKKKLYEDSVKMKYTLIIVYSLKEKSTNEILYKYLTQNNVYNFMFSYTSTLFDGIEKLPSKYDEIFRKIYPKIKNFLKIQKMW